MPEASPSQQFGKYLLLERIAMGGMAEIFRAKKLGAEGFEKELVIKRVLPHYSEDASFVTMFKDEAKIAANLNHSNICQVFEFDEQDGSFYIAMEYIPGRDLKRVMGTTLQSGVHMTVPQLVWIGAQVASGLHYAHTKEYNGQALNIVHRDVTPHNVMISMAGDVKLMDFGIAKAAARSTRTQAGTVKGKCAYMSPEQARGKDLDGRSDVFSLGIVMWEALARQRLFLGDTEFNTLSNVLKKPIPSLSSINAAVTPALEGLIMSALERDRNRRFESAAAFEQALLGYYYSECDPSKVQLSALMKFLFDGGPRPELYEPSASQPVVEPPTGEEPTRITGSSREVSAVDPKVPPPPPRLRGDDDALTTAPMKPMGDDVPAAVRTRTVREVVAPWRGPLVALASGALALALGFMVFQGLAGESPGASQRALPREAEPVEEPVVAPVAAPQFREITVESSPPGALLYIDGSTIREKAPFVTRGKVGGLIKVKAILAGHRAAKESFEVGSGEGPLKFEVRLVPK